MVVFNIVCKGKMLLSILMANVHYAHFSKLVDCCVT